MVKSIQSSEKSSSTYLSYNHHPAKAAHPVAFAYLYACISNLQLSIICSTTSIREAISALAEQVHLVLSEKLHKAEESVSLDNFYCDNLSKTVLYNLSGPGISWSDCARGDRRIATPAG